MAVRPERPKKLVSPIRLGGFPTLNRHSSHFLIGMRPVQRVFCAVPAWVSGTRSLSTNMWRERPSAHARNGWNRILPDEEASRSGITKV
jgi:hypothetical protein